MDRLRREEFSRRKRKKDPEEREAKSINIRTLRVLRASFENWGQGWRDMPPFSSSVGERKIMNHSVVILLFFAYLASWREKA